MNSGESWTEHTYRAVEARLGYTFSDRQLLLTAFTASTYANNCGGESNERLEWLGDALLGFFVSDLLYHNFRAAEGELTELRKQYVSRDALTPIVEKLGLMEFLRFSGGKSNFGPKIPSSVFEAVVAAIYLDGGVAPARAFTEAHIAFTEIIAYKTVLQEYVQGTCASREPPVYLCRETEGGFACTVSAVGRSAEGTGETKKAAETAAAKALYEQLKGE